jgi:hypothetical protein
MTLQQVGRASRDSVGCGPLAPPQPGAATSPAVRGCYAADSWLPAPLQQVVHRATFGVYPLVGTAGQRAWKQVQWSTIYGADLQRAAIALTADQRRAFYLRVVNVPSLLLPALHWALADADQTSVGLLTAAAKQLPRTSALRVEIFACLQRCGASSAADVSLFGGGHGEAFAVSAAAWGGVGPLPAYLQSRAQEAFAEGVNGLLRVLAEARVATPNRRDLWDAMVELCLPACRAHAVPAATSFCCAICLKDKEPLQSHRLTACNCEIRSCSGCTLQAVRLCDTSKLVNKCPTGCNAWLQRRDFERLGMPPQEVSLRHHRVVEARLATVPSWLSCSGANCFGGQQASTQMQRDISLHCLVCSRLIRPGPTDALIMRRLLIGLEQSSVAHGNGLLRECYHCGGATEKGDACAHMTCTRPACGGEWHFVRGPYHGSMNNFDARSGTGAQAYRPLRDGALGAAGFYEGLPRGHLSVADTMRLGRRAALWLRERVG